MRRPLIVVMLALAVIVAGLFLARRPAGGEGPGVGLRRMALTTRAESLGFAPDAQWPRVYGVLTDWNTGGAIVSLLAMRDGTASLYTDGGVSIIGGQSHEQVRAAALECAKLADGLFELGRPVADFPCPGPRGVHYYLLAYEGPRLCATTESALNAGGDPTVALFDATQVLMKELRLLLPK